MRIVSRLWEGGTRIGLSLAFLILPLIAWADDDDRPIPLDPQAKATQLWTFGTVVVVVLLGVGLYIFRRWQILRSGASTEGFQRDED